MRNDYVLDEVEIGRGRATRDNTSKKPEHLFRKWIVAGQLAEISDEQDHAEINAQNDKQRARDGPSRTGIIRNLAMSHRERRVHSLRNAEIIVSEAWALIPRAR